MGKLKRHIHRKRKERERKRARKNLKPSLKARHKSDDKTPIENILRAKLVISDAVPETANGEAAVPDSGPSEQISCHKPSEGQLLCRAERSPRTHELKKLRNSDSHKVPTFADFVKKKKKQDSQRRVDETTSEVECATGRQHRWKKLKAALKEKKRQRLTVLGGVVDDKRELLRKIEAVETPRTEPAEGFLHFKQTRDFDFQTAKAPHQQQQQQENDSTFEVASGPSSSFAGGAGNKALQKMRVAQFRMINEMLYTSNSEKAEKIFEEDRRNFDVYHEGYRLQVGKWLLNPVDKVIADIKKQFPQSTTIADLGCGDAKLATCLKPLGYTVYSFDLVAANEHVQACNIRNVPLSAQSVDLAVMCLSLMGTDMGQFVLEANRILKARGKLIVAEVESRIPSVDAFVKVLKRYGFSLESKETARNMFYYFTFCKAKPMPKGAEENMDRTLWLNPCLYKKR